MTAMTCDGEEQMQHGQNDIQTGSAADGGHSRSNPSSLALEETQVAQDLEQDRTPHVHRVGRGPDEVLAVAARTGAGRLLSLPWRRRLLPLPEEARTTNHRWQPGREPAGPQSRSDPFPSGS